MKSLLILLSLSLLIEAKSSNDKVICHDILKQIQELEEEQKLKSISSVATVLMTGSYSYNSSNKSKEIELKILKQKLKDCK